VRPLEEFTFPDRLRLRVVMVDGLFVAVAGALLGGLETGRAEVWRWAAFEVLRPPFQHQLADVRRDMAEERAYFRRLVAGWGIPWREVSLDTAAWQVERLERMPEWVRERLVAGELGEDRLDKLRRSLVNEDVSEVGAALAACRVYEERALERPAVIFGAD
jgi:hypothetical protein